MLHTDSHLNILINTPPDTNGKLISVIWMVRELAEMLEIIARDRLPIRLHCPVEEEYIDRSNPYNRRMIEAGLILHPLPATPRSFRLPRHLLRFALGQLRYPFLRDGSRLQVREINYFHKRYAFLSRLIVNRRNWILHSHTPDLGMPELVALKKRHRIPLMVTLHGEGQRRMMAGQRRAYWDPAFERRYRRAVPFWDLVVFVSEDYRQNLSYLEIPAEKTRVVQNGVNVREFFPAGPSGPRRQVRVLCFSDLHAEPLRGLHYVIRAAAEIVKQRSDVHFSVIYGRNSKVYDADPYSSPMGRLMTELGLSDHFQFFSWIEPSRFNRFINDHDIVLHPTFADTCSNFILEGMACGKPVIASNGCGNDELVDSRNGILVDYDSLEQDIVRAVLRLAESESLREQMGRASLEKVHAHFNAEREGRECLQLYREIAASMPETKDAHSCPSSQH